MQISAPLLLQLGAVLTALALLGALARRFALSPIPLYLLAGLLLGKGGIQPVTEASVFVKTGAPIGVVLLLLTLGLEFSSAEFASSMKQHVPSALVDVVLNATPGAIAGWLLGFQGIGILALAGVTYVSSSGLIARLLEDLNRVGNRETPAILAVLVLEDFAMAAYLPVFAVLVSGGTWLKALLGMVVGVGAFWIAFVISHRWGHYFGRLVGTQDSEQLLLRVLGVTLIVAALAEEVHASAAVGAFLVGLTLTGDTADRARKVLGPLRDLFAAVFFLGVGIGVDPHTLAPAASGGDWPGRGDQCGEGGDRYFRGAARRGGPPRATARRHRPDRSRRILVDHHRFGRVVDSRPGPGGDVVRVRRRRARAAARTVQRRATPGDDAGRATAR